MRSILAGFLGTVAVATVWACAPPPATTAAGSTPSQNATDSQDATERANAPVDPQTRAAAALADSVRSAYTPADVDFMTGMIHHHAQALVMSDMAPTHGASRSIQLLASRIINAQKDEIASMQQWLRDRDQPVPDAGGDSSMHETGGDADHDDAAMHHGDGSTQMPGMLSPEQLAALNAARGADFDRLFLSYMIQHHLGAVTMVEDLIARPGAAREQTVFKLASDIGADQASEITRMQIMLEELLFDSGGT